MIVVAAILIVYEAVQRLIDPQPLQDVGIGLVITVVATVINGVVGYLIIRAGRRARSLTLVADGKHLMTDVWTSIGVIIGVALVALDSIVAIAVALNILWTGSRLVQSSVSALLDGALSPEDQAVVVAVLDRHRSGDVDFHGLQTRESGRHRFVSVHVLVPGAWTVQQAHDVVELVEGDIETALEGVEVTTHVEPREDARSYDDAPFDASQKRA